MMETKKMSDKDLMRFHEGQKLKCQQQLAFEQKRFQGFVKAQQEDRKLRLEAEKQVVKLSDKLSVEQGKSNELSAENKRLKKAHDELLEQMRKIEKVLNGDYDAGKRWTTTLERIKKILNGEDND